MVAATAESTMGVLGGAIVGSEVVAGITLAVKIVLEVKEAIIVARKCIATWILCTPKPMG